MKYLLIIYFFLFFHFEISKTTINEDIENNHPRVLLIGIDGLNPSCIKDTSYFDYFIQNGSYTFKAKSTFEAWSSSGWSALLCSIDSSDSGILNNEWIPSWLNSSKTVKGITNIEANNPLGCIFEMIKLQNKHFRTGFYYDWDWLEFFGNKYMKEEFIDDEFSCIVDGFLSCDGIIKERFMNKIQEFPKNDFYFFFLYLGGVDFIGHEKGWCGEEYMKQINSIDEYIRKILDILKKKGLLENTYIMMTSDHGADIGSYNHGKQNDANIMVPWFVMGPGIRRQYEISANVHLVDTAPTIMKMMGLKKYFKWRGKKIMEIFENFENNGFLEKCVENRYEKNEI